jgi:hypothetical protein
VFYVIDIQYPVRTRRRAETLALYNELLAAPMWVRFEPVSVTPLEIGTLVFSLGASLVVWVRLIAAFTKGRHL